MNDGCCGAHTSGGFTDPECCPARVEMDRMPIVTLTTGLRVANFSSPHPFTFTDGSVLPGCSAERSRALMLESKEVARLSLLGVFWDIGLTFEMSASVLAALVAAVENPHCTIVLVPFPVMQAAKAALASAEANDDSLRVGGDTSPAVLKWNNILRKIRTCRAADRVAKTIHHDRFCI